MSDVELPIRFGSFSESTAVKPSSVQISIATHDSRVAPGPAVTCTETESSNAPVDRVASVAAAERAS